MKTGRWLGLLCAVGVGFVAVSCDDEMPTEPEVTIAETAATPVFDVTGTPNKQMWKQCQNNHDYTDGCDWVTGNLNQTHNTWSEGDFVPKILRINHINNTDPFQVVMTYGFMKGGLITHDFLGQWEYTQTGADPCVDSSFSPFCTGGNLNDIDITSNQMDVLAQAAVAAQCGGGSQEDTDMAEAIAEVGAGLLVIDGINVSNINVTDITLDGCPVSGDAEMVLTMTVTPTGDAVGDAKSTGLLLLMAAHVARAADWTRGGAGGVSGSPYHLGLVTVDGESAGSMDLRMSAAAIVTPATKSGMKFNDLNADGVKDTGEPGLSGWTIYVDYNDNDVLDTGEPFAVTDGSGNYTITDIDLGTWKVKEVMQAGWTCSYPSPCYHQETFAAGDALTGNDFGNYTTATKSGMKFNDLNADGVKDTGEPGLSGWTIYVDYNDNDVLDTGEPFAVTDGTGSYSITGITPGTWKAKEVAQTGWTCSYPSPCYHQETFVSGVPQTGNDFGNYTTATKSGMKFEDLNADGVKDTGEPGLSGWTIYVDYNDNDVLDTGEPFAVTDGSGNYTITGINPGAAKVKEVAQTGWTCSYPSPCYYSETFKSGDALTGNDFGNWTTATKSGMKFEDLNADGVKDTGEPGLSGWTIYVDYNDNDVLDTGEPFAVTDGSGNYTITGINPGAAKVKEVAQTGWMCSYPNPCYYSETFKSGDALTGNDFGNYTASSKSGMKFNDLNADGVKDTGEPGLSGWTIYVDYNDDDVLDTGEPFAVTDGSGNYTINGIAPGTWKVKEVAQTGWTCSLPSPCYYQETFVSGVPQTGNDFGNYTASSKSGMKFNDLNADGVKDTGEPGLSGWTIYVDYNDDDVLDTGEPFAVTDGSGNYTITGINPGAAKVKEVAQTGWTCSLPSPCYYSETFQSGVPQTGNDFGNYTTATKSGMKFEDLNADGVKDTGEPGLSGWTIYVDYNDDDVLDTGEPFAVTDGSGNYTITGINPGAAKVKEVAQTGWTCSYPSPCYYSETFKSGDALTGNDFGNYTTATKSGMKFNDLNADGVKDTGEPGLSGWTIYVDYNDNSVLDAGEPSDVTDGSGDYMITGINPGAAKVREVAQTDWTCSFPSPCYYSETFQSGVPETGNDFGNWIMPECALGERLTSVRLAFDVVTGDTPFSIQVTDDNGNMDNAVPLDPPSPIPAIVGTAFTVNPLGGTYFDSQNLRFFIDGEISKNLKVHLSCSDDPAIGDIHIGDADGNSVTLRKVYFETTQF